MNEKEKCFIDLSKCSESEIKELAFVMQRTKILHEKAFDYMSKGKTFNHFICLAQTDSKEWTLWNQNALFNKTELTYPDFIKLFEGGVTIKSDNTQTLQNALEQIENLEAEKKELLEALQKNVFTIKRLLHSAEIAHEDRLSFYQESESLIQKHKQ